MLLLKSVWADLAPWIGTSLQQPPLQNYRRFKTWWLSMTRRGAQRRTEVTQRVIYTAWNIWKERYRRVFDNQALSHTQLQTIIKEDVGQWLVAWSHGINEYSGKTGSMGAYRLRSSVLTTYIAPCLVCFFLAVTAIRLLCM
jgi:hypothetical protein